MYDTIFLYGFLWFVIKENMFMGFYGFVIKENMSMGLYDGYLMDI